MDDTGRYLKKAYLSWGVLWVAYNVILLVAGLIWLWLLRDLARSADHLYCRSLFGDRVWSNIYLLGVLANVAFCPEPLAEAYAHIFLGRRMGRGRYFLFVAVLLLSMYLIFSYGMLGWTHVSDYLR